MDEHDTTSQAVEALLFLSSDPGTAHVGSKRPERSSIKAVSTRQSDNGHDMRPAKRGRSSKGERAVDAKPEPVAPPPLYQPRDLARSTSSASEGNPLASPASTSARILQQMAVRAPAHSGNPPHKQSVKVQGIQHEVSATLLERAATEPQLLSFRRTGKSLNLCMLYNGTPYAGYFALNTKANEELNADSSSRSSNGSQAALAGVDDEAEVNVEAEAEGGGRGRRRRTAHNYAQLADGSASASLAASRPSTDAEGKERIAKQKEIDSQQEWLRMQMEGPANGAVCALCHGPEDICRSMEGGAHRAAFPRHLGKLVLARPSAKRMPCWVHEQCALWSADLYHTDAQSRPLMASLGAALRRGLGIACSACHRKGATVSCVYPLCKKVFHVGCAVSSHCHMDPSARWCTACPEHYAHAHHALHARINQGLIPDFTGGRMRKPMRRPASALGARSQALTDQQRNMMSDPGFAMPPLFMNPANPFGMQGMQPFPGFEGLAAANQNLFNMGAMGNIGAMGNMMQSLRMRMGPQMMPGLDALSRAHHDASQLAAFGRASGMPLGFDQLGDVQGSNWLASTMYQDSMHSGSVLVDETDDDGLASGNRCSVCRVQRKGRCGTLSAPRSCLKRKAIEQAGLAVPPGPPKASRPRDPE